METEPQSEYTKDSFKESGFSGITSNMLTSTKDSKQDEPFVVRDANGDVMTPEEIEDEILRCQKTKR